MLYDQALIAPQGATETSPRIFTNFANYAESLQSWSIFPDRQTSNIMTMMNKDSGLMEIYLSGWQNPRLGLSSQKIMFWQRAQNFAYRKVGHFLLQLWSLNAVSPVTKSCPFSLTATPKL